MVWYSHLFKNFPQFVGIHTVKGFGVVNKAEVDVFLELSYFFDDSECVFSLKLIIFSYWDNTKYLTPLLKETTKIHMAPLSLTCGLESQSSLKAVTVVALTSFVCHVLENTYALFDVWRFNPLAFHLF